VRSRSASPAPVTLARRRADIQGLRAVAILLVVLYHGGFHVRGGFSGVDVFFAISGFVIAGTLVRELVSTGSIELRAFYARRVRRLLPALAMMVGLVSLVGILATPIAAMTISSRTGIFASIFGANLYLAHLGAGYFDVSTTLDPLLHTWTLGVEEQFYVVFPAVLLGAWLLGRRTSMQRARALAFVAIGAVSLASGLLAVELSRGSFGGPRALQYGFYLSPARAWEFGAGALVAIAAPAAARMPHRAAWMLAVFGAVAVGVGAVALSSTNMSPLRLAALPIIGTCALLAAGTSSVSGLSRLLGLRPLTWLGDLSYSWYLWHWPLIVFAKAFWPQSSAAAPIAAVVSLLPAWASYRFVESPIRGRRDLVGRRAAALATVCAAVGVGASAVLLVSNHELHRSAAVRSWERSQTPHLDETRECDSTVPLGERRNVRCTWSVPHPRGLVVLVGDSNAGHFSEPFVQAANALGYDATIATVNGCPYIDLVVRPIGGSGVCRRFYVVTSATLVRLRPSLVVIAARSDQYVGSYGIGEPGGPLTRDTPARLRLWQAGIGSTLRTLNDKGIPALLVEPVPLLPVPTGSCATLRILTGSCAGSISRSAVDAELGPVIRAERAGISSASLSASVDFENELCGKRCSSTRNGVVMYRNAAHLSVDGARLLTPAFRNVIGRVARPRQGSS
jgi:peptidoglycan/LPS O-acetylase OafA/YrhL